MIAPVTQPTRRFRIGRADSNHWVVIDTHLGRVLPDFDSEEAAQEAADAYERDPENEL